jgi:hypothetical protein
MSTSSPSVRTYKRLGYLAIAHAGALLALTSFCLASRATDEPGYWLLPLWVGLVTLWFFWPVVLVLHHGRSALRFALFGLIAAVLLLPSLRFYSMEAPWTFGFPPGVTLNPSSIWQYFSAYREGRAQAKKDIAAGVLALEEAGLLAGSGPAVDILRERYHIEVRAIAQCIVDERIRGHEAGYNSVSKPEIDRRIGPGRVEAAREEGNQAAVQQRAREQQAIKDLTTRLTTLPPDGKVTTESVWPYVDQQPLNNPGDEEDLRKLLREIELCVANSIPEEAPAFKLHVTVRSSSGERPTFEISSPDFFPPKAIWQTIDKNLQAAAPPPWSKGYLYLALDFAIRAPRP